MNLERWTKAAAPAGYDGECYSWGNYMAVSTAAGRYRLQWHLLRRQTDGRYDRVAGCRPLTQTFAVRPCDHSDVSNALDWAENQIMKYRARRTVDESGPYMLGMPRATPVGATGADECQRNLAPRGLNPRLETAISRGRTGGFVVVRCPLTSADSYVAVMTRTRRRAGSPLGVVLVADNNDYESAMCVFHRLGSRIRAPILATVRMQFRLGRASAERPGPGGS